MFYDSFCSRLPNYIEVAIYSPAFRVRLGRLRNNPNGFGTLEATHSTSDKEPIPLGYKHHSPEKHLAPYMEELGVSIIHVRGFIWRKYRRISEWVHIHV